MKIVVQVPNCPWDILFLKRISHDSRMRIKNGRISDEIKRVYIYMYIEVGKKTKRL